MPENLSSQQKEQIAHTLKAGNQLEAIRLVRQMTGCGLTDAKSYIEGFSSPQLGQCDLDQHSTPVQGKSEVTTSTVGVILTALQVLSVVAIFCAAFWSVLWLFPFITRLIVYAGREMYKPETFIVTGGFVHNLGLPLSSGGSPGNDFWLSGTIAGHEEILVPPVTNPGFLTTESLCAQFTNGTKIAVLYNPHLHLSNVSIQGERPRVLVARPNVWKEENFYRFWMGRQVLIPVPLTWALFCAVRAMKRRYLRR